MRIASFVLGSVALLIQHYADKYQQTDFTETLTQLDADFNLPRIRQYDFIVVGGGTAGCIVAGRLSEKYNVLLLESGGDPPPTTYNVFLNDYFSFHPSINLKYTSIAQVNLTGVVREMHVGKMLGGSGSHNGNLYNRGSPQDYDNIARLTGDDTWSYSSVLKHFKNIENFIGDLINEKDREQFYSTTGLLTVDTDMSPLLPAWFQAGLELGYSYSDPNANQSEGFAPVTMSMKNGEKDSTYTAFIKPFENIRANLTVLRYSEVQEVLINNEGVAYGVLYTRHGIPQIAHATKEVIISAGTIPSPLLLMRSGIGNREVLQAAKIPVKSDVPGVGQNLRDHCAVILFFTVHNPNTTIFPKLSDEEFEAAINAYQQPNRGGYLARMDVTPQAFFVSSRAKQDFQTTWPDFQFCVKAEPVIGNNPQRIGLQIILNRAKSSGTISLNTTAYLNGETDYPKLALIDNKLWSDPSDVTVLIEAINLGLRLMETTSTFTSMNTVYDDQIPQECTQYTFRSDAYWECFIRRARGWSWNHFVGTNQMGPVTDNMAVVDSKLKVRGVKGLRVIDASVIPRAPSSNINAPVMLIAEKGAQDILHEYA